MSKEKEKKRVKRTVVYSYIPWKNYGNNVLNMSLYDLKIANALFKLGMKDMQVVFELSFRKNIGGRNFSISLGQTQLIDFLLNYHFDRFEYNYLLSIGIDPDFVEYLSSYKWKGNMNCFPDGFFVYPYEPIVRIECDVIGAILIGTNLIQIMESNSFSATQATRIFIHPIRKWAMLAPAYLTDPDEEEEALFGITYLRECDIPKILENASEFKYDPPMYKVRSIPHTWIELFDTEWDAFKALADIYPNDVSLLIDTYDIFNSGIINAIKLDDYLIEKYPNNSDKRVKSVLICNENLSSNTKSLRKILDDCNKSYIKIIVLNETSTNNIEKDQSLSINSFDMKKNLIFSSDFSVFDSVYNLVAIKNSDGTYTPKMGFSDVNSKFSIPGFKTVYRINKPFIDGYNVMDMDIIAMSDEIIEPRTSIKVYPIGLDTYIEKYIDTEHEMSRHNPLFPYIIDGKLNNEIIKNRMSNDDDVVDDEFYFYQRMALQFINSTPPETLIKNYSKNFVYLTEKVYKTQYETYKKLHG